MVRRLAGLLAIFMLAPWTAWGVNHWWPVSVSWNLPWGAHWAYFDSGWVMLVLYPTPRYVVFSLDWQQPVHHYRCVHVYAPAIDPKGHHAAGVDHHYDRRWQVLCLEGMSGSVTSGRAFSALMMPLGWVLLIIHSAAIGVWWRCRRAGRIVELSVEAGRSPMGRG